MGRYNITTCDVCGKDITTEWYYKFYGWYYRIGKHGTHYMCEECMNEFKKIVKEKKENESN